MQIFPPFRLKTSEVISVKKFFSDLTKTCVKASDKFISYAKKPVKIMLPILILLFGAATVLYYIIGPARLYDLGYNRFASLG